jgi:hypothetical protein
VGGCGNVLDVHWVLYRGSMMEFEGDADVATLRLSNALTTGRFGSGIDAPPNSDANQWLACVRVLRGVSTQGLWAVAERCAALWTVQAVAMHVDGGGRRG